MKKYLILIMCTFFISNVQAQALFNVGDVCPNFTATDTKGNTHDLYTYCNAGKYVLVDFFAYWCGPCVATSPMVEAFYKKYGCNTNNVIVLGNESDAACTLADLHTFEQAAGLDTANSYPVWLGSNGGAAIGTTYGGTNMAYPTFILIGPDKKLINKDIWPMQGVSDLEAAFPANVLTPTPCAPTAVNDLQALEDNTLIYPNPATDLITVKSLNIRGVDLTNQLGQKVISQVFNNSDNAVIDASELSSGVYFLELNTKDGKLVKSISIR